MNNLSAIREFQTRYRDLLAHYGVSGQWINARQAHENADAESSHGHFKTAADQALLLRGSRAFATWLINPDSSVRLLESRCP